MSTIKVTAETLQRIISLCGLPNVIIRVCGKEFFINQSILSLIFNELQKHFSISNDPFVVSLNHDGKLNSLFAAVTPQSLIESCSIFLLLLQNGSYSCINSTLILSLIFFSRKISCGTLNGLVTKFSKSTEANSVLFWEMPITALNSFPKSYFHNEFSFRVCSKL
jgi:hypothetical protein